MLLCAIFALTAPQLTGKISINFSIPPAHVPTPGAKPQHELTQWHGYLVQLGAAATVHALGNVIACHTEPLPLCLFVLLCKHGLAKAIQESISRDAFEFTQADWASSDNNYANFWGWLIAADTPRLISLAKSSTLEELLHAPI